MTAVWLQSIPVSSSCWLLASRLISLLLCCSCAAPVSACGLHRLHGCGCRTNQNMLHHHSVHFHPAYFRPPTLYYPLASLEPSPPPMFRCSSPPRKNRKALSDFCTTLSPFYYSSQKVQSPKTSSPQSLHSFSPTTLLLPFPTNSSLLSSTRCASHYY